VPAAEPVQRAHHEAVRRHAGIAAAAGGEDPRGQDQRDPAGERASGADAEGHLLRGAGEDPESAADRD